MNISGDERKVLRALHGAWNEYEDFCFLSFRPICRRTKLNRQVVRRCCRALKRKGLAQFERALWTEDGELAGSGYGCTKQGAAFLAQYKNRVLSTKQAEEIA